MAHKKRGVKHHKPSKRHGGRRMGAIGKHQIMDDVMGLLGLGVGQIAATALQRQMTSMNVKVVSGVQVLGGMALKHHVSSPFMQAVGWGVAGAGTVGLAHDFGVIHGVDNICDQLFNRSATPGGQQQLPGEQHMHYGGSHEHYGGGYHHHRHHEHPMVQQGGGPMPNVSGLDNYEMMSGISNYDLMSGHDGVSLSDEAEGVQSLGL